MKKLITVFLFFVLSVTVIAEENKDEKSSLDDTDATVALSGTIVDSASGELLVGVEVFLEETGSKTYTDFDGRFSFKNVQPGEYKLITDYISYKSGSETLKVAPGKKEVSIHLEASN